jgi:hypothetical protein
MPIIPGFFPIEQIDLRFAQFSPKPCRCQNPICEQIAASRIAGVLA